MDLDAGRFDDAALALLVLVLVLLDGQRAGKPNAFFVAALASPFWHAESPPVLALCSAP